MKTWSLVCLASLTVAACARASATEESTSAIMSARPTVSSAPNHVSRMREMMELANAADGPEDAASIAARYDALGYRLVTSVRLPDTANVDLARKGSSLVLAFRGTGTSYGGKFTLMDWIRDFDVTLVSPEGFNASTEFVAAGVGARYHKGFIERFDAVAGLIAAAVESEYPNVANTEIYATGHSSGGAYAQLCAWYLFRQTRRPAGTYAFATPLLGNQQQADAFDRELGDTLVRAYLNDDPAPASPSPWLFAGYARSTHEINLDFDPIIALTGEITSSGEGSALPMDAGAHFPERYLASLRNSELVWKAKWSLARHIAMNQD